jgi:hypothetical protein
VNTSEQHEHERKDVRGNVGVLQGESARFECDCEQLVRITRSNSHRNFTAECRRLLETTATRHQNSAHHGNHDQICTREKKTKKTKGKSATC